MSCRLRVALPEGSWERVFSMSHPTVRLEVLDRLQLSDGLTLLEVQISSESAPTWREELRHLPGVTDVELISASEGSAVYRIVFRGTTFIPVLQDLKLVRHFPFPIQDGEATWTVVGPETKVRRLLGRLKSARVRFNLESVHHGPLMKVPSSLTPRQREILQRAIAEGYFDVPRRISLTKLAPKIGIAMSTLSVTLAVIEKKIVEPHA